MADTQPYPDTFLDHLLLPRGRRSSSAPSFVPDGTGTWRAGEHHRLIMWVGVDAAGRIQAMEWRCEGIPKAIPYASALTFLVQGGEAGPGMHLIEAQRLDASALCTYLLSGQHRLDIAEGVCAAFQEALRGASSSRDPREVELPPVRPVELLCRCLGLTEEELRREVECTPCLSVPFPSGAGAVCGGCRPLLQNLLRKNSSLPPWRFD